LSTPFVNNPDYVILGAGCAGLSLLMRMIRSEKFADKKILLIDKAPKTYNDRTWCFWEKQNGFFEEIVYKKWHSLNFYGPDYLCELDIAPYQYKMIRGIDFYNYCFEEIKKQNNVEIIFDEVKDIFFQNGTAIVSLGNKQFNTGNPIIFNSIYVSSKSNSSDIHLLQHFKGWKIETERPVFNPAIATLMDFRVRQDEGTTFSYTLPFSETKALIEYTLFTERLLNETQYDMALEKYIREFLKIDHYKITEKELGVIPMTNEKFQFYRNGMYHIGTAGGQTKPSSGYTFQFIQKQSERILNCLMTGHSLQDISSTPKRFHFYDTVLLRLLKERKLGGDKIFSKLFENNKASTVFKFLDNETSIREELKLIATLPAMPFLKAAAGLT